VPAPPLLSILTFHGIDAWFSRIATSGFAAMAVP
jgi:hypothetical protein